MTDLVRREIMKQQISNAINDARLSPALVAPVVKEIYELVVAQEQAAVQREIDAYNAKIKAEAQANENDTAPPLEEVE